MKKPSRAVPVRRAIGSKPPEVDAPSFESEWRRNGATLSDKTAAGEFGMTRAEIVGAIRAGSLQCREGSVHGNPFLRLLRREVEALVRERRGDEGLRAQKASAELARIDREIKTLKRKIAVLEKQRAELSAGQKP